MLTYLNPSLEQIRFDIIGLSTDVKPINDDIKNATVFYEMDTQKIYMFDEENQQWLLQGN